MRQEMSYGCRPQGSSHGNQPKCAKVIVCRRIKIHQPLFPQLHYGNSGEGLGDRSDPKDGVLSDRRLGPDIGKAVPMEPRDAAVIDDGDGQSCTRPAIKKLSDCRLQVEVIDSFVRHDPVTGNRSA
jgi:hypothetical protein